MVSRPREAVPLAGTNPVREEREAMNSVPAIHDTMRKFGYPASLVRDFGPWVALVRPQQPTLGSLVLVCTERTTAFGAISDEAFAALAPAVREIEGALAAAFRYDKINWLMLMMVDKEVHFHVIPRYSEPREFGGRTFADAGWPLAPELDKAFALDSSGLETLVRHLQRCF
jgi:diadenosine tetraphosphate (Ap4A) HIT family hydrolase